MGDRAPIQPTNFASSPDSRRAPLLWRRVQARLADDRWCSSAIWWITCVMFFVMLALAFHSTRQMGRAQTVAAAQPIIYQPVHRYDRATPVDSLDAISKIVETSLTAASNGINNQPAPADRPTALPRVEDLQFAIDAAAKSFGGFAFNSVRATDQTRLVNLSSEEFAPVSDSAVEVGYGALPARLVWLPPQSVGAIPNTNLQPFEWFIRGTQSNARSFVLNAASIPNSSPQVGSGNQGEPTAGDPIVGGAPSGSPEPSSLMLLSGGIVGILFRRRPRVAVFCGTAF